MMNLIEKCRYDFIQKMVMGDCFHTATTHELVGEIAYLSMGDNDNMLFTHDMDSFNAKAMATFIREVMAGNTHTKVGPYDSAYYVDMMNQAKGMIEKLPAEGLESRRFIITVQNHCFTSIHMLIRGNKDDPAMPTICTMRSCNLIDNFIGDIYIAFRCAREFSNALYLAGYTSSPPTIVLEMNFGSLHIFNKDIDKAKHYLSKMSGNPLSYYKNV